MAIPINAYIIDLERPSETAVRALCLTLDDAECIRAKQFAQDIFRRRYIIAHGMLRRILGRHLQLPPQLITFGKEKYGKPFILNKIPNMINFSLSTSGGMGLVVIGEKVVLGADIEKLRPIEVSAEFLDVCLSQRERKLIGKVDSEAMLTIWTLKEAVIKATGQGLFQPLTTIEFDQLPPFKKKTSNPTVFNQDTSWQIETRKLEPDSVASIAVRTAKDKIEVTYEREEL